MKFVKIWNRWIDRYLERIDSLLHEKNLKKRVETLTAVMDVSPASVVQATALGLFFCLIILLLSCQATPREPMPKQRPLAGDAAKVTKQSETLYLKREKQQLKAREPGSTTGSIWADSRHPKNLFLDEKPTQVGDIVMVEIPPELQYKPGSKNEGADKQKNGTKQGNKEEQAPEVPQLNPPTIPVTQLKMEVIAMEPNGDVYLRGRKFYENEMTKKAMTVMAKIPSRNLTGFKVNANDFTQVELNEDDNGQTSEYVAQGWDTTVSRKLSGFVPDMKTEMQSLEDARQELLTYQKALQDRAKAVVDERERIKKDRDRLLTEQQRWAEAAKEAQKQQTNAALAGKGDAKQGNPPAAAPSENKDSKENKDQKK